MPPRIEDHQVPPGATKVMMDLQHYVDTCGLEPALLGVGEATRLADQRLSLLHRHAHEGLQGDGPERAGTREPDHGGGRDQRLEPPGDQLPLTRRGRSTEAIASDVTAPGAVDRAACRVLSADPCLNGYSVDSMTLKQLHYWR